VLSRTYHSTSIHAWINPVSAVLTPRRRNALMAAFTHLNPLGGRFSDICEKVEV
jgi:hypothetical protein